MKAELPVGKYVVAVSGGVDSVVLLDLLSQTVNSSSGSNTQLVIAHFDHGIRPNSKDDTAFVQSLAAKYDLEFFTERAELGRDASEATARKVRYDFLYRVQAQTRAAAIVTAHHQDDVLETMLLNLIRGTKWRGLHSLRSTAKVQRPLLSYSKREIMDYASSHKLTWHEDSTNVDTGILRNYLRHTYIPHMSTKQRAELLGIHDRAEALTAEIDTLVSEYLLVCPIGRMQRADFRAFSDDVAREMLVAWLRRDAEGVEVSSAMLGRLLEAIRHGRNGSTVDVKNGYSLTFTRDEAVLIR